VKEVEQQHRCVVVSYCTTVLLRTTTNRHGPVQAGRQTDIDDGYSTLDSSFD
jgi:hypothetical protein